jgi:hypothetical protein
VRLNPMGSPICAALVGDDTVYVFVIYPKNCHPRRSGAKRKIERGPCWNYAPKPHEVPDLRCACQGRHRLCFCYLSKKLSSPPLCSAAKRRVGILLKLCAQTPRGPRSAPRLLGMTPFLHLFRIAIILFSPLERLPLSTGLRYTQCATAIFASSAFAVRA